MFGVSYIYREEVENNEKVKTYGRDCENAGAVGKIECVLIGMGGPGGEGATLYPKIYNTMTLAL